MDPVIISAVIAAVATIVVAFITSRPSRSSSVPNIREIRYQQLCLLLEPTEKILFAINKEDEDSSKNAVLEIRNLLDNNYKLVPPFLYREVLELSKQPILLFNDLKNLQAMNSSLYNWHCKHFGYPYNSKKIIRKYSPMYSRHIILKNAAYRSAPILSIVISFLSYVFTAIFDLTTSAFLWLVLPAFILLLISLILIAESEK